MLILKFIKYFADKILAHPLQWFIIGLVLFAIIFSTIPVSIPILGTMELGNLILLILGIGGF